MPYRVPTAPTETPALTGFSWHSFRRGPFSGPFRGGHPALPPKSTPTIGLTRMFTCACAWLATPIVMPIAMLPSTSMRREITLLVSFIGAAREPRLQLECLYRRRHLFLRRARRSIFDGEIPPVHVNRLNFWYGI